MIFILGIERSATTWISNLIEAHPRTQVFVEPLSVLTARFSNWPDRFEEIENRKAMADYFRREFQIIKNHKTWFLTRWFSQPKAWQFDLWLSNLLVRKKLAGEAARDFSEINFHRKTQLQVKKEYPAEHEVIKELRLNFNGEIISCLDPKARVLVVVRDVFANIRSISQQLSKGHLSELKHSLQKNYGAVDLPVIYRYWKDSYNRLLSSLESTDTPYLLVDHTNLLKNSEVWIRDICEFIGLDDPRSILEYLEKSNRHGEGIHNTNRSHRVLLKENADAKREVWPKIEEVFDTRELHPDLQEIVQNSSYP